uniref:Beta-lactamase-like protein 2 homolog n=1 Tax=Globodera rostochiensis TaxID=31243 RepID=A0A914HHV5_GLORO
MLLNLTPIEDIVQLSPRVIRVLGKNPGPFTLQGTNTYLLGMGKKKILIDAGEANVPDYLDNLRSALGNDQHIVAIIATHWHRDHIGGISEILRRFVSKEPILLLKCRRRDGKPDSAANTFQFIEDGHQISVEGATLKVVYTPGHTSDHISLWLEEEKALFSGDCVLGEGTTIFENLTEYMTSLAKLLELSPTRIYPGHGPVIENPQERVQEYIRHRLQRERDVLEVIRTEQPVTAMRITSMLYPHVLSGRKIGALQNMQHHLTKLVMDGAVVDVGFGFGMYKLAGDRGEQSR